MAEKRKGVSTGQKFLGLAAGMGAGVVLGIMLVRILDMSAIAQMGPGEFALSYGLLIVVLALALLLQLIIHEAGHLVFGLATGYGFSSFRIGSLMLQRVGETFRVRRLSIPGTGGQCLMIPPGSPDEPYPVVLYNLGGVIANLVTAALAGALVPLCGGNRTLVGFLAGLCFFGIALALVNGIPQRGAAVPNDGWNALNLHKNELARRSLWVQLAVSGRLNQGERMRDMPNEWFVLPEGADLSNVLVSTLAVFDENRLVDQHDFEGALRACERLLAAEVGAPQVYVALLACDLVFCQLVLGLEPEVSRLEEQATAALLRQMRDNPSVLRTQYALALLVDGDKAKAASIRAEFDKIARSYPAEVDITLERELMALAQERLLH